MWIGTFIKPTTIKRVPAAEPPLLFPLLCTHACLLPSHFLATAVAPIAEIIKRVPAAKLSELYKIGNFKSADQFLQLVAHARGKLRKGGVPDMISAAKVTLQVGARSV